MKFDNNTYIICSKNYIYKIIDGKYANVGLFVDEINYMSFIDLPHNIKSAYLDLNNKEFKLLNINIELSYFKINDSKFYIDFKNKIIFNRSYIYLIEKNFSYNQTIKLIIENGKVIKKENILFDKELVLNNYSINLFSDSEYLENKLFNNRFSLEIKRNFKIVIDNLIKDLKEITNTEIINCLELIKYSFYINSFYNCLNNIRNILFISFSYIYENNILQYQSKEYDEFNKLSIYWWERQLTEIKLEEISNTMIDNNKIICLIEKELFKNKDERLNFKKVRRILNYSVHRNHYDKEEFEHWELGEGEYNFILEILDICIKVLKFCFKNHNV